MRALKMSVVAHHPLEFDNDQLRTITEADPLTTTWDAAKELKSSHCMAFGIWCKLERWKILISGYLMSWPNIKKIVWKCHLLLPYSKTTNHLTIRLWHVTKSGFYMTTSDEQLSGWTEEVPKHFAKPSLHQKRSWSLSGGLLPIWATMDFWIPVKQVQFRSMLGKLMRCTENHNACNQY